MKQKNKLVFLIFLILLSILPFIQTKKVNYSIHNKKHVNNIEPLQSDIYIESYFLPGVSEEVPPNQIIKIGILGDLYIEFGDHMWMGAKLAAKEINEEGGMLINGTHFYIGLVIEDTNHFTTFNLSEGEDVTEKMINDYQPHFIIGGFIAENILALNVVMDNKIPLISTGTANNDVGLYVLDNYERYKYLFRTMPVNGSYMTMDWIRTIIYLTNYLPLIYGGTMSKIAILRNNFPWVEDVSTLISNVLSLYGLTIVEDIAFPVNATSADFNTYWDIINSSGAQITFPIVSSPDAITMLKTYRACQPRCLIAGMNLLSQSGTFWDDTEGACQYEITMQAIHRTAKTPLTIPFWNNFSAEYNVEPAYTGVGTYDAVYILSHAVEDAQTFEADTIVKTLEKINSSNPRTGVGGVLAFTQSHEVLGGWGLGFGLITQWNKLDGTKVVIPTGNTIYNDSLATGSLRLPYWGINGLLTDPPDPPGEFTLDSNAGNPDQDGKFNLSWTVSEGANNYSVYMSERNITYISKNFNLLANQISASSLSVSGLNEGEYYFVIVAYNNTGETMSSNVVRVTIPSKFPYEIVIIVVIVIIVGSILTGMIVLKRKPFRRKAPYKKDKQGLIVQTQKEPQKIATSKVALKSRKIGVIQDIEKEVWIQKEEFNCIVHGGKIVGSLYICPSCETYYCLECASDLKSKGETCQVCEHEIQL